MNQGADADWSAARRTHPWSIVVNAVHEAGRVVVGLAVAVASGRALGGGGLVEVVVPVGAALLGVLAWARTSFRVTPEGFRLDSGVLFRQSRSARFDRIQAVDIDQPAIARVFGLAELRVQFGGGRAGHFRLACVRLAEATRLRAYLLDRVEQVKAGQAAGVDSGTGADDQGTAAGMAVSSDLDSRPMSSVAASAYGAGVSPVSEADETPLAVVPAGRYLAAAALSGPVWFAALASAVSVAALVAGSSQVLAGALPETVGAVGFAWDRVQRYYGFTLAVSGDRIRLRHGLLNRYAQTVPISRLQAIEISQPLLWRATGWARVHMNVAGYAHGGGRGEPGRRNTAVLLTVAPAEVAFEVAGRLLGVKLGEVRLLPAPSRARWRALVWWRGYALGFDETVVVARRGLLHRRFGVIPHAKVQSLHLVQGPWQRALSLASVTLHSTRGPVSIRLKHRDVAEAQQFLEQQSRRSAIARRART